MRSLECPGKPNLLPVCLLICRVFWFLCQQIWFQPIFHFSSFSVPVVVWTVCSSAVFFILFFFLATQKKLHATPKKRYDTHATPKKSYTATPKKKEHDDIQKQWPLTLKTATAMLGATMMASRAMSAAVITRGGEGGSVCGGVLTIVMSLNMDIVGRGEERRMKIGVRALSPPLR